MPEVSAASYEFVGLETVLSKPLQATRVESLAIVLTSSPQRISGLSQTQQDALQGQFVYQTKVKVKGKVHYRLALGNFDSTEKARAALGKLKPLFVDAWIYQRSNSERQQIRTFLEDSGVNQENETNIKQPAETNEIQADTADSLLLAARQAFLDENYVRVIALTEKISAEYWDTGSTENLPQIRESLELAGTTRERQAELAGSIGERRARLNQAVVLYETTLDTDPPEEVATRISNRLQGIRTMSVEPRARLAEAEAKPAEDGWDYRGSLYQYYREDIVDGLNDDDDSAETVNRLFVTNVGLQMARRTEAGVWAIGLDTSLINDLQENETYSSVSNANIGYTTEDLRLVGGRQNRTLTGLNQRFDGISYKDSSRSAFQLTYALGYLVESYRDDVDTDHPFIGVNVSFSPYDAVNVDLYFVEQEISGLTDRQSVGSEIEFRNDVSFFYGIIDYDTFYQDMNNVTLISNYRYTSQWDFNLTASYGYSPTLSTLNALQGQAAVSIENLKDRLTNDQIYQLAQDRTSRATNLYFGSTYQIDTDRQLYFDFSVFNLDATDESDSVLATDDTESTQVSLDYSVRDFFSANDYSTVGFRLLNSTSSDSQSIRFRTRLPGYLGLIYDPRVRLEKRLGKNGRPDQSVLDLALKLTYRATKKLNFETDFGIEYSDLDLPDLDSQTAYRLYAGYVYFF
ncbi:MAG: SPOR domain-containing protein [Gammaproteobacteria bacterium]|nr:SPOR domain-containing protein [Gammaproteobacteria bacterium]